MESSSMGQTEVSNLICDVGAHKGEDSAFYLKLGYRVLAVEANPWLARKLRQRFRDEIEAGTYILIDKAIAASSGENIAFYVNKMTSEWGTTDLNWVKRNEGLGAGSEQINVQCVDFAHILETYGCPLYLKVDIEGADMLCVNALKGTACRPKYISFESTKTSWRDLLEELHTMEALGYTRFKVVNQRKHESGRFKTRTGGWMDHSFEQGSTGAFGEDLKGRWLTKNQTILRYVPIFLVYITIGDNTLLRKCLRRIPGVRRVFNLVGWYDTHAMR